MKSIILSIIAIALMVGLLFFDMFLFGIDITLGIIGIIVWIVVPGIFWRKADNSADGLVSKLLTKYVFPSLAALIIIGVIIYVIWCASVDQPILFNLFS